MNRIVPARMKKMTASSASRLKKLKRLLSLPSGNGGIKEASGSTGSWITTWAFRRRREVNGRDAKIDRDHISKLPWELKRMLTHYLDDVSATCLRLTCTSFYEACAGCLHRPSRSWCCNGDTIKPSCYTTSLPYRQLGEMLRSDGFFGELIYFNGGIKTGAMFVTEERLGEILKDEAAEVERH